MTKFILVIETLDRHQGGRITQSHTYGPYSTREAAEKHLNAVLNSNETQDCNAWVETLNSPEHLNA